MINNPIICKLFKEFTNRKRKTNRARFLAVYLTPAFLNIGTTIMNLQTICKTRLLQTHNEEFGYYIWKFRLAVHQRHYWNTVRTKRVWWIKVHYEILNYHGVTEILCSFRLVLEGKTGKEIRNASILEYLEKFLANNFALLDANI